MQLGTSHVRRHQNDSGLLTIALYLWLAVGNGRSSSSSSRVGAGGKYNDEREFCRGLSRDSRICRKK